MEGVITEEDYKTEVHITPKKRWIIVGVCMLIAAFGVFRIQQDRNWNPFQSGGGPAPVSVR